AVPLALRNIRNNHAEPAAHLGYNDGKDSAIRLTINKILVVARFSFALSLVKDPAALEVIGEEFLDFGIGGLAQVFIIAAGVDIGADNHQRAHGLCVARLHGSHELVGRFERRAVDEVVVIAEGRGAGSKQSDEK